MNNNQNNNEPDDEHPWRLIHQEAVDTKELLHQEKLAKIERRVLIEFYIYTVLMVAVIAGFIVWGVVYGR